MKKIAPSLGWIAMLAIIFTHQVRADMIVDTGIPNLAGNPLILSDGQWLAAKFSTNRPWQLDSIEGFIDADTGNPNSATFTLAIYGNGSKDLPDTNDEVYSQQATFTGDGWNGLYGLNWALDAGNYWLAFEVRSTDTLQGLMPVLAPISLQKALSDGFSDYSLVSGSNYNFGARISAVPAPPILLMLVPGLLAMGRLRMRQSII